MSQQFGLYVILTEPAAGCAVCAKAAVDMEIQYLQLRMKRAERERIIDTAYGIKEIVDGTVTRFIINDDPEIAALVGADGVHLGQDDMPLNETRMILGEDVKHQDYLDTM